MAKTKYFIRLTDEERAFLAKIVQEEKESARAVMRAKILLLSDRETQKKRSVPELAEQLGTTHTTIQTVRAEYAKLGLEAAVFRKKRTNNIKTRRINLNVREKILAMAAGDPPEGRQRWSLRLLCREAVNRGLIDHISEATMSSILKSAGVQTKELSEMPRPKGSRNRPKPAAAPTAAKLEELRAGAEALEAEIEELSAELKAKKEELGSLKKELAVAEKLAAEKKAEEDKKAILAAVEASGKSVEEILALISK